MNHPEAIITPNKKSRTTTTKAKIFVEDPDFPSSSSSKQEQKKGRKPKGGKIIENTDPQLGQEPESSNIILHLKCFKKDLANHSFNNPYTYKPLIEKIEAFEENNILYSDAAGGTNIINSASDNDIVLSGGGVNGSAAHPISSEDINIFPQCSENSNNNNNNNSDMDILGKSLEDIQLVSPEPMPQPISTELLCANTTTTTQPTQTTTTKDLKELMKKLHHLEFNLHTESDQIQDKRSACFWCTCDFESPPIYIPKHFLNEKYMVYGNFCSPECGIAFLEKEDIDASTKMERRQLMNLFYGKIFGYQKNIKPAPSPYYTLEKFLGNMSPHEYRKLLKSDRLLMVVDKPFSRILPELLDDHDDVITSTIAMSNSTANTAMVACGNGVTNISALASSMYQVRRKVNGIGCSAGGGGTHNNHNNNNSLVEISSSHGQGTNNNGGDRNGMSGTILANRTSKMNILKNNFGL